MQSLGNSVFFHALSALSVVKVLFSIAVTCVCVHVCLHVFVSLHVFQPVHMWMDELVLWGGQLVCEEVWVLLLWLYGARLA